MIPMGQLGNKRCAKIGRWVVFGCFFFMGPSVCGNEKLAYKLLGGGFNVFLFSSLFGEDSHFDEYFSDGLKPPTRISIQILLVNLKDFPRVIHASSLGCDS